MVVAVAVVAVMVVAVAVVAVAVVAAVVAAAVVVEVSKEVLVISPSTLLNCSNKNQWVSTFSLSSSIRRNDDERLDGAIKFNRRF